MGLTYIDLKIKAHVSSKFIRMLVDTGSIYIVLDPQTIKELGLYKTPYNGVVNA